LTKDTIAFIETTIAKDRETLIRQEYDYVAGQCEILDASPSSLWEGEKVADLKKVAVFKGIDSTQESCSHCRGLNLYAELSARTLPFPLHFLWFRAALGHSTATLDGLHHGDEADGEQREATYISGRENETVAVDGLAGPDFVSPTGEIADQFVVGNLGILLPVGKSVRREYRADDGFVAAVITGPGKHQLLVAKESSDGNRQRHRRRAAPTELENLTDRNYRGISWGLDAPGRGVFARYAVRF
jgi:hypothetical protein